MDTDLFRCPKCSFATGDDWKQCGGSCPMKDSPYYKAGDMNESKAIIAEAQTKEILAMCAFYYTSRNSLDMTWNEMPERIKSAYRGQADWLADSSCRNVMGQALRAGILKVLAQ